ncbi:hypothetical protein SLS59_002240 [Nothophoma quercina]|uniref:Uncharacterized protein n=1 Tax=Nothophoma quercina TaxID=749835 RepID=A0ABR3RS61_9PLEO
MPYDWPSNEDLEKADSGRCAHIAETFSGKSVDIDTKRNYLDSTGKVQTQHAKINEIPINWIAHQYPGKASSESPFISEFVMLHDDVNTRKMILWSEPSSSGSKKGGAAKKAVLVADDIVALRDIIGVYRYHTYPEIQKILTMQIERIGAAFKYLENGPLKSPSYKPMSTTLESQWNAYMKAKYASIITDIETTMKDLTDDLKKTKVKRGWLELLRRGAGKTTSSLCGQESDEAKMNARIDLLLKEYEAVKGKWKNPMP